MSNVGCRTCLLCALRCLHTSGEFRQNLLKSAPEGEQAAQEVFVQAWGSLNSFRFESPFENWLMRIDTRTCLNLCRTKKSQDAARGLSLDRPEMLAVVEARLPANRMEEEVEQKIHADQLLRRIRHCARTTRPPWDALDWHTFHLLYEQNVTTAREVARLLCKSEDTIKYRIYRRINPVLNSVRAELEAEEAQFQHDLSHPVSG